MKVGCDWSNKISQASYDNGMGSTWIGLEFQGAVEHLSKEDRNVYALLTFPGKLIISN